MANSRPEKAIINTNGIRANIKKMKPEHIMLKVKPLKILNNMCPDNMLAANLNPRDIFLAKYDRLYSWPI